VADGVIIGSDYKIRFMNSNMVKEFGEGTGSTCYEYLRNLKAPFVKLERASFGFPLSYNL